MNTTFERWIVELRARTSCDSRYKWSLLYQFHSLSEGLTNIPPVCQSLIKRNGRHKSADPRSRVFDVRFLRNDARIVNYAAKELSTAS